MEAFQLQEHAKQLNDFAAAMIELEAMKVANKEMEINNQPPKYTEKHFRELMQTYELGYNENIMKSRRFF